MTGWHVADPRQCCRLGGGRGGGGGGGGRVRGKGEKGCAKPSLRCLAISFKLSQNASSTLTLSYDQQ